MLFPITRAREGIYRRPQIGVTTQYGDPPGPYLGPFGGSRASDIANRTAGSPEDGLKGHMKGYPGLLRLHKHHQIHGSRDPIWGGLKWTILEVPEGPDPETPDLRSREVVPEARRDPRPYEETKQHECAGYDAVEAYTVHLDSAAASNHRHRGLTLLRKSWAGCQTSTSRVQRALTSDTTNSSCSYRMPVRGVKAPYEGICRYGKKQDTVFRSIDPLRGQT